jgi:hypothetical protein
MNPLGMLEQRRTLSMLDWARWSLVAPVSIGVHQIVLALYPPVGDFLGGFGETWMYQVAFLIFSWVAVLVSVWLAGVIAPRSRRTVVEVFAASAVVFAVSRILFLRNPLWSDTYSIIYVLCMLSAAVAALFLFDRREPLDRAQ